MMDKQTAKKWNELGTAFHTIREKNVQFCGIIKVESMFGGGYEYALKVLGLGGVIIDDSILLDYNPHE